MAMPPEIVPSDATPPRSRLPGVGSAAAVVVVHGRGQQQRHSTLGSFVRGLRRGSDASLGLRTVSIAGKVGARAETTVGGRDVHVYEAYWAHHAAAKATLRDVMAFLLKAGLRGVRNSTSKHYTRRIFNHSESPNYPRKRTALAYLGALVVVLSALIINAVSAALLAALVAKGEIAASATGWPGLARFEALTAGLLALLAVGVVFFLLKSVAGRYARRASEGGTVSGAGKAWAAAGMAWFLVLLVAVVALATVFAASLVVEPVSSPLFSWVPDHVAFLAVVWGLVAAATWWARSFLVDCVGDVATYVGGTGPSRLGAAKEAILSEVAGTLRGILEAKTPGGEAHLYGRVVVVGHSLGSVVAYDALNVVLREDIAEGASRRVVERGALVTFGSPLDKLAFLFGYYKAGQEEESYLAMSESPLILDYQYRSLQWVNLYSKSDIVSGALDLYDAKSLQRGPGNLVRNVVDPAALTPLAAHNEYWRNPRLFELVRELLATGREPTGDGHRNVRIKSKVSDVQTMSA